MKIYKGIIILSQGDWAFGFNVEMDRGWDKSLSATLTIFKLHFWLRIGFEDEQRSER